MVSVIDTYEDLLVHTDKTGCILQGCSLHTQGCAAPWTETQYININSNSPYKITASEIIPAGYQKTYCIECTILGVGATVPRIVRYDITSK